jgi:hypothetical protein
MFLPNSDVSSYLWCFFLTLMFLPNSVVPNYIVPTSDVSFYLWCFFLPLMFLPTSDVSSYLWCFFLTLMFLPNSDVSSYLWCFFLTLMFLPTFDVSSYLWCFFLTLMFLPLMFLPLQGQMGRCVVCPSCSRTQWRVVLPPGQTSSALSPPCAPTTCSLPSVPATAGRCYTSTYGCRSENKSSENRNFLRFLWMS